MPDPAGEAVSFARDIRPLFRERDVDSMIKMGLDLSDFAQVSARADAIGRRLAHGDMPCDGPWPAEQVALFDEWIADGKQP